VTPSAVRNDVKTMNKRRQFTLIHILLLSLCYPVLASRWFFSAGSFGGVSFMEGGGVSFAVRTTAFSEGGMIPKKYTCDDADLSPGLEWVGAPAGTQSLGLIVDDPDAPVGTWTHWIIWNIPPGTALAEGVAKIESPTNGASQGKNDFKRIGYGGPCPPPGKPHRYFFKLYALDAKLDLKAGANRNELERAMKGHVLSQAELIGRYRR
jgi:Raf kinase inhibitor-like YbhB/YbcL family protein